MDLTLVPDRDTFRGSVDIHLDVRTPADVIWLNAVGLDVQQATFQPSSGAALPARTAAGGDQFLGFAFDRTVSGPGVLHVDYTGKISRISSAGVFQLQEDGRWYLYSQFEPTDARRAFPCFDEPNFKVPWQMALHVPKDDLALSNTPVESQSSEANGMQVVRFKQSPPLPSYLVAFAVGPFDVVDAGRLGPTPLRVIVPKGKSKEAADAAVAIPQLLKLLEDYFGIPFPYEKLDSVIMPVSDFAMENAGLITYAESSLLANPATETIEHKRELAGICAHEMSHQWFGDLVTTAWWNDTWLNEAFATWMERKIPGEWKPDWHLDVTEVNARLGAMRSDELASAREIRQPIESNDDIANAFDDITYEKGGAVIEMFEHWIGPEKFRAGVQAYLRQHAWGNATASDFEAAMGEAAGRDVAPAFNSFLDQPGVPEVSVKLKCGEQPALEVSQKRSLPVGSKAKPQLWQIPVCVAYEANGQTQHQCTLLTEQKADIALSGAQTTGAQSCPDWILPNDGETGYYQVAYQDDLLKKVLADHGSHLTVAERVGVLGDVDALSAEGEISAQAALALVPEFSKDPDWHVVQAAADIAALLKGESVPPNLRDKGARFIREQFGDQALALAWVAKPGENDDTRLLRQKLVPFVASSGEQEQLIAQAGKLAREWLMTRHGVGPDMLEPVLRVAAEFGNRELFDELKTEVIAERDHHLREVMLDALGSFRNPELARASLDLLLSKDIDVRESFYPLLFGPISFLDTREIPFDFVKQHLDELLKRLPREVGEDYAAMLPSVGATFCDTKDRNALDSFFADRVKDYNGGPRTLAQTLEGVDLCIAARKSMAPELTAFLNRY